MTHGATAAAGAGRGSYGRAVQGRDRGEARRTVHDPAANPRREAVPEAIGESRPYSVMPAVPQCDQGHSQDKTVIKGTSQDASVSYLVGDELVPKEMGVMTVKTKEIETFSETIYLACIRSALLTAEHYVKKQNRPMAEWWFDRADYETQRLAKYRGVTLSN